MHPWLVYTDWLRLPTYFTCLMVGFALATFVLRREALREGLAVRLVMDLALWALPTVLIGARLGHIVLVAPGLYWQHPLEALQIANGGFVFYGGLIAGGVLVLRFSQHHRISAWVLGDVFAPATAFGLAFGRLGCLGGGCCFGRPAEWPTGIAVPWAIRYYRRSQGVPDAWLGTALHPAPLYASLFALALFVVLCRIRARQRVPGETMLAFFGLYGLGRIGLEATRGDLQRGLYLGGWVSTSQIIAGVTSVIALTWWARRRRSAP